MKVKQSPDDFRVEEITTLQPESTGPYSLYRLTKTGWTTPDALQLIRRKWNIDWRRIAYGGLKDRHAHTVQYLTIFDGPDRRLKESTVSVEYLGRVADAYRSIDIQANRFELVIRDVSTEHAAHIERTLDEVRQVGVPNYFDDQRFGSVGEDNEFIARLMVRERYEDALKLALAGKYAFDKASVKREKALLRQKWGDWPTLKQELPRGHARSLVDYLVHHPTDFKGALARLRPELRTLYLSAYQSHLWNRMLAHWIEQNISAEGRTNIRLRMGLHPVPRSLGEDSLNRWRDLQLPLPSNRLPWDADAAWAPALRPVLDAEGMELSEIRLRGFKHPFFAKGEREAAVMPIALNHSCASDEKHPGRQKVLLSFDLPRGSYATMVIKRVTARETVS